MGVLSRCSWCALVIACASNWGSASVSPVDGRPHWLFRSWLTDEGLPDNCVTGLAQTNDGFIWVATLGGLLRFNGHSFIDIPLPKINGVSSRVVRAIFTDRHERLWVAMERGRLICFERDKARLYGPDDGLPDQIAHSIAEDDDGHIWIAFPNGLVRVKDGQCRLFGAKDGLLREKGNVRVVSRSDGEVIYAYGNQLGFCRNGQMVPALRLSQGVKDICVSASSSLWICEGSSLRKFRDGAISEEIARLPDQAIPKVMLEDLSGALWIGTVSHGLFRLVDEIIETVPTSHQGIDCLMEDREGNIWVGTSGGGLNQVRPQAMTLMDRNAGLPSDSVRSVCEDSSGSIWVTLQSGQIARFADGRWIDVSRQGVDATCVAADQEGAVWLGSRNMGLHRILGDQWQSWDSSDGLAGNAVRSILVASDGKIWVASDTPRRLQYLHQAKIHTIEMPPGLTKVRSIRAMAESQDGTIWIGTANGELMYVEGDRLILVRSTKDFTPISIRSLHAGTDGEIWIAHASAGIGRWKNGAETRITSAMGLKDDYVSQILRDKRGAIWFAGNRGLFQLNFADLQEVAEGRSSRLKPRVFGRSEGLAGLQASFDCSPSAVTGRDGRLWMAMRTGLLMVDPDKLRENPNPPPVVLERVAVDESTAALYQKRFFPNAGEGEQILELGGSSRELRLPPDHNKLDMEFAALSYTSAANVHFRYKLINFDQKWIEAGNDYSAHYPRLPAGNYEFRVIACNNAGVWNETGASLRLVVDPFYWQTPWFRSLVIISFSAGVIASVRYLSFRRLQDRIREFNQQTALHQERARIARDMHDEVGAKLTRLSLLSDMAAAGYKLPPDADAEVREISETARETILAFDEIVWAVNPRNDTLGDLINYLCRHAEDFFEGGPTQCVFELPRNLPDVMLPTEVRHGVFLAVKEALTNVGKYAAAELVCLRLLIHSSTFELIVEDDGCGFDPTAADSRPGGGNGILNMRERMHAISARFECSSHPGGGTRIAFHVPIRTSKP